MHALFYHQNYPAQFGQIARRLQEQHGWRITYVCQNGPLALPGGEVIRYQPMGGATAKTHFSSRTFENFIATSDGLFQSLAARTGLKPDLIVGHSGFGSTLFLRDLFDCPQVNYFEYYYRVKNADMDYRPEVVLEAAEKFRARARNAPVLLDLAECDAAYSPTQYQRDGFPEPLRSKIQVIFDGIDTDFWTPGPREPKEAGPFKVPAGMKLVTYAARGLESMRGFQEFMQFTQHLLKRRQDVVFAVVGNDKIYYGPDAKWTGGKSYKQWVLEQGDYDLSRIAFLGLVTPEVLRRLFQISDLHIYLTAPFVLSWSLLNALACGALVLASDTPPVQEVIQTGHNGILHDLFDAEGMAAKADAMLSDPNKYNPLRKQGREVMERRYSLDVCFPKLLALYESTASRRNP